MGKKMNMEKTKRILEKGRKILSEKIINYKCAEKILRNGEFP